MYDSDGVTLKYIIPEGLVDSSYVAIDPAPSFTLGDRPLLYGTSKLIVGCT